MKDSYSENNHIKVATNYLPKLLYFFQLTKQGAMIEAHENFVKSSDRNRCYVMSDKGVERLSVPIKRDHGKKMLITQVGIDYSENWHIKHLRALRSYYGSAPYFEHFFGYLDSLLGQRYDTLFELNCATTSLLAKLLGLSLELKFTDDFYRNEATEEGFVHPQYYQVFSENLPFAEGLSAVDYLFCEGKLGDFFENLDVNHRGIINAPIIR